MRTGGGEDANGGRGKEEKRKRGKEEKRERGKRRRRGEEEQEEEMRTGGGDEDRRRRRGQEEERTRVGDEEKRERGKEGKRKKGGEEEKRRGEERRGEESRREEKRRGEKQTRRVEESALVLLSELRSPVANLGTTVQNGTRRSCLGLSSLPVVSLWSVPHLVNQWVVVAVARFEQLSAPLGFGSGLPGNFRSSIRVVPLALFARCAGPIAGYGIPRYHCELVIWKEEVEGREIGTNNDEARRYSRSLASAGGVMIRLSMHRGGHCPGDSDGDRERLHQRGALDRRCDHECSDDDDTGEEEEGEEEAVDGGDGAAAAAGEGRGWWWQGISKWTSNGERRQSD
ncbi:hypothetical protein CBR_g55038 [Chara braunii]|uniref:Uncharacterized protein n=1 Tax=Chara braunii TaxID=69332 RepID=A0A388MCS7_CHABU|nr:hypothetical protein CBR_g55038 [Chara braunii]|eukprot:GBG92269.1 hypothetical protein CBR_g55038 [Chara braunii]